VQASVTFGMTRPFVMRRSCDHNCKLVLNLSGGDLLVMAGTTQRL
jgi:alkylated DNA repair dioxygenase AlkB